ncbi:unnamed protein product [Dibothriocephalus latus]|uniref:Uncharacterized protein n=1 Tax=Dibothriocephalus latus TaxID=60516 RepID=A0A3P7LSB0_DIBLA|nr:unnamed protein product [Dibothriocephalus latus]
MKRPESALSLAEKFLDREQIVALCDLLDRYLQEDASAFPLDVTTTTTGCATSLRRHDNLARLLTRLPADLQLANYALQAAQDLYSAGLAEGELLGRRRTLLSLSKLAQIAGDDKTAQRRRMMASDSDQHRYFRDDANAFPSPFSVVANERSAKQPEDNRMKTTQLENIDLHLEALGYQVGSVAFALTTRIICLPMLAVLL